MSILLRDLHTENSLMRFVDNFLEKDSPKEKKEFRELSELLGKVLVSPALAWSDFSKLPPSKWLKWSFVYDRQAKVILPVIYGGHTYPASLLYAFRKGVMTRTIEAWKTTELFPGRATASFLHDYADRYCIEGMGATYGFGRGLIYGGALSRAEREIFYSVTRWPIREKGHEEWNISRE